MTDCISLNESTPQLNLSPSSHEVWDYKEFTRTVEAKARPVMRKIDSADIICVGKYKRPGTALADKEEERRMNRSKKEIGRATFPVLNGMYFDT
jgi:hypothetical protein